MLDGGSGQPDPPFILRNSRFSYVSCAPRQWCNILARNCCARSERGLPKKSSCVASSTIVPAVHEDHAVRDLARKAHLVRDDHHRHAFLREQHHDVEHLVDHLGVERRRGLVEQHADRIHRQRARNRHPLLLPAGQLPGKLVLLLVEAHAVEQLEPARRSPRPCCGSSTLICASVRFSVTVRCGNSSKCWNTIPTRARSFGRLVFGSCDRNAVDDDVALLKGLERVDAP